MKTKQRALLALLAAAVLLGAVLWAVTRSNDKGRAGRQRRRRGQHPAFFLCRRGLGADRVHL